MEELQLRLLEKQLTTKFFYFGAKTNIFLNKWRHHQNIFIALNLYTGTNVLVYERRLVKKKVIALNLYIGTNVLGMKEGW